MKTNGDITTYNYATVRGRKMFYREAGNKDTPTIVLLHGFPSSRTFFSARGSSLQQIPRLRNHARNPEKFTPRTRATPVRRPIAASCPKRFEFECLLRFAGGEVASIWAL
jgi:hypothetical protein